MQLWLVNEGRPGERMSDRRGSQARWRPCIKNVGGARYKEWQCRRALKMQTLSQRRGRRGGAIEEGEVVVQRHGLSESPRTRDRPA